MPARLARESYGKAPAEFSITFLLVNLPAAGTWRLKKIYGFRFPKYLAIYFSRYNVYTILYTANKSLLFILGEGVFAMPHKTNVKDTLLHAFLMIHATAVSGVPLLGKKRCKRELEGYLRELCLLDYQKKAPHEQDAIRAEWRSFALRYLSYCTGSRSYCSTLFGIVPINDAAVASKIAADIRLVLLEYPAAFELSHVCEPLLTVMGEAYCEQIENGKSYWEQP